MSSQQHPLYLTSGIEGDCTQEETDKANKTSIPPLFICSSLPLPAERRNILTEEDTQMLLGADNCQTQL